jgi:hypothetical protein
MYLAIAPIIFLIEGYSADEIIAKNSIFFEINLQALLTTLHLTLPGINRPILLCWSKNYPILTPHTIL